MNDKVFFFFYSLAHQSQIFDKMVIFAADIFPYIVVVLAAIFLLIHHEVIKSANPFYVFRQKKKEILIAFFSGILAWILSYILKHLFTTLRPFEIFSSVHSLIPETGFAFPSGHATFFMALAVSLYFYHKKVGYVFIFFALIIGFARIIAGVHFPIDILGGFILGAVVAIYIRNFFPNSSQNKSLS